MGVDMSYYGIDLGTSNCLVAKVIQNLDDSYDVKCLSNDEGEESFPSIVYFENSKKYMVGNKALKHLYTEPDSTIELIKVRLGKSGKIFVNTKTEQFEKSPQEISSCLIRHFNTIHYEDLENAIITVPAFFDQNQKDATMQAGCIADMNVKSLIEEPTAAIMYHIFSQYKLHGLNFMEDNLKNVLVFDFGGGTLDLSLIELSKENGEINPRVIATGGDEELGGNNIDFIFTKFIIEHLKWEYEDDSFIKSVYNAFEDYYLGYIQDHKLRFSDNVSDEIKNFIFSLKRNLENVKIKLSLDSSAIIVLERNYKTITITRQDFEQYILNDEDINIKNRIKHSLQKIGKQKDILTQEKVRVDEVLLIGGSSQIPYIKKVIIESLEDMAMKKEHIKSSDDFDKAVAKGAAIQSAISSGVPIQPFMLNKCESVVSRDIELEHAGGKILFIPRGTEYPLKEKMRYSIHINHALSENIELKLNEIVDNDNKDIKRQICDFDFYLPIYYTGEEIEVSMNIDEAGLYRIEAVHLNTKEMVEFEPNKEFSLSEKELSAAVIDLRNMKDVS